MQKAITGLLSLPLILSSLFSIPLPQHQPQNDGSAWVLVEVIDIDAAEDIAKHNKDYEDVYHLEGSYSEGIFSLSSTYIGPSDDYYDPPQIHGESLAFTAYFSSPPQVIYPNDEITINILLSAVDNHSYYNPFASVKARISKNDQSYSEFTNANGEGTFLSDIKNNYAPIDENVTAIAPGGAEGDTLELKFVLYYGVNMETRYIYKWNGVSGVEPGTEQPAATTEPMATINPTPTACPAYTETEKLGVFLNLYYARIPRGVVNSGIANNIIRMVGFKKDFDEFTCGGYQTKVLNLLNAVKFSEDPCLRQVLDNWDYGPIQAWYGAHQAVVIYPKGTYWKSSGIVLDPWINQGPDHIYRIDDWAKKMSLFNRNPIEVYLDSEPYYDGVGPSEVYHSYFDKYPIFGNDYVDTDDKIKMTEEELKYTSSLTPEELDVLTKLSSMHPDELLKHVVKAEHKIHKVIARCPLNLYIMDGSGNRSGVSGTEILTELPNVSFMVLELTDGTNYTEITYPENAGYTLVLEGSDEGQAYIWQGYTLLLGETPPPLQQYSFPVSKGKTYQIATNVLGAPMQWDGGSLAPEPVTEISEELLDSLPGLLTPEALDADEIQNLLDENIDYPADESKNTTNIWIFLLCGLAFVCFLLIAAIVIIFFVVRNKKNIN